MPVLILNKLKIPDHSSRYAGWVIYFIMFFMCCTDNLPTFPIDQAPSLNSTKRLMVIEGTGTMEVDLASTIRNETRPTNLHLKMSRRNAEKYLGKPLDSSGVSCSYFREDTKYKLYFDRNDSVESINISGPRIVSGFKSTDGSGITGLGYGQDLNAMVAVYGVPKERSEILSFYPERGIGFVFDVYSKRLTGMEVRVSQLWIKAKYGTSKFHIGMSRKEIINSLESTTSIDSSEENLYSFTTNGEIYSIWLDPNKDTANLLMISSDNFVAYTCLNNSDTLRKVHNDDPRTQVRLYYGTPTNDTSESTWWYDSYGIGFSYFSDKLVGSVFIYSDPQVLGGSDPDQNTTTKVKYCFINKTDANMQLWVNNTVMDTITARDSTTLSNSATSNVKMVVYIKSLVATDNYIYWRDTLMSGTDFRKEYFCGNDFFLLRMSNSTDKIMKNIVVSNTQAYDSSEVYLKSGSIQNVGYYRSSASTYIRAYFYSSTTILNWNALNTTNSLNEAKLLNCNSTFSMEEAAIRRPTNNPNNPL